MAPHEKVVIFEDHSLIADMEEEALIEEGHTVLGKFSSLQAGLDGIPEVLKMGMTVAITDGDLGSRKGSIDGDQIAATIKQLAPQVTIISGSGDRAVKGADYIFTKGEKMQKLIDIVTLIPR